MHIWEILGDPVEQKNKPKRAKRTRTNDFEKNAGRLRSKVRKLNARKPVKSVSPD